MRFLRVLHGGSGAGGWRRPKTACHPGSSYHTGDTCADDAHNPDSKNAVTYHHRGASGKPYIGGPFVNFTAKYGPPFGHGVGDSDNFYADSAETTVIDVSPTSGTVTYVSVIGPTDWSDSETFNYCIHFLPDDATEYNSAGPNTDYQSTVGYLVVSNYGSGTCVIEMFR
jgi:hypothetical protein